MATFADSSRPVRPAASRRQAPPLPFYLAVPLAVLRVLASLKITVVLFFLAIILILIGTLAQTNKEIWQVMDEYFRSWMAWVEVKVFFPEAWFPASKFPGLQSLPYWFPFPGGLLIGTAMFINLLAAHLIRFKMQARGIRLWAGLIVSLTGIVTTVIVIRSGSNSNGVQGEPILSWSTLWVLFNLALLSAFLAVTALTVFYFLTEVLTSDDFWTKIRIKHSILVTVTIVLGVVIVWLMVRASSPTWALVQLVTLGVCIGVTSLTVFCYGTEVLPSRERWKSIRLKHHILSNVTVLSIFLVAYLLLQDNEPLLNPSSLRILWQLLQGAFAALVLLGGCVLVFKKRAGIVLLHSGVGLMMLGELLVGNYAVEGRMSIREGETVNYVKDLRAVELAVVDTSNPAHDEVTVVPVTVNGKKTRLARYGSTEPVPAPWLPWNLLRRPEPIVAAGVIRDEQLPFDVQLINYYKNAALEDLKPDEENPATAGIGAREKMVARETRASAGADTGGAVDLAAAYVKFTDKRDSKSLGTYLLSQLVAEQNVPEKVTVDGKTYDVYLRFERTLKPYSMHLYDVRKDDYLGTSTPRNYSSEIQLVDDTRGEDRRVRIWMNNPLRYAGETFYQSGYNMDRDGTEFTDLQVVTNAGWMIPYVACMIVVVGMLAQFMVTLVRFLNRIEGEVSSRQAIDAEIVADPRRPSKPKPQGRARRRSQAIPTPEPVLVRQGAPPLAGVLIPVIVVFLAGCYLVSVASPRRSGDDEMKLEEFGKIPVIYQGRVKPFDTVARNGLNVLSFREEYVDESGIRRPAVRWLLDVITDKDPESHKVIRVENLDLLETFGLQRRSGFRYSVAELREHYADFDAQVEKLRGIEPKDMDLYQRKVAELDKRIRTYTSLRASFQTLPFPDMPTEQEFKKDPKASADTMVDIRKLLEVSPEFDRRLAKMEPPLAVPASLDADNQTEEQWLPYPTAFTQAYLNKQVLHKNANPATESLTAIFAAYREGDARSFNREVAAYLARLGADPPAQLKKASPTFETYFNHAALFYHCDILYVFAFVLAILGWLFWIVGWNRPLHRAAFWLIVFTLFIHTVALISRIYISGRPPVTNLYSSAVFIGWAAVVFGIIIESIFRLGVGNVVGAVAGFATLLIAQYLSLEGDTFTVLQAVLDTQFWLATHVVCVTLGYAATFFAGTLAVMYIIYGLTTPLLKVNLRDISPAFQARKTGDLTIGKALGLMTYGIVCFAIFFSFFGTVLGGLWADDSWGRFWGWDPKENGALMIVLWNALVLHARWGGLVKERGFAVLVVGGNIVTSWSWFGVNELGIGLHSYGFTEGVLRALGIFVATQLAIIVVGMLPKQLWWSFREDVDAPPGQVLNAEVL